MTHLDHGHPVRTLIEFPASSRKLPSRAMLDELLEQPDLPEGMSLSRFRARIAEAAKKVAEARGAGDLNHAKDVASHEIAQLAAEMTPEEAACREIPTESSSEIASRMFGPR